MFAIIGARDPGRANGPAPQVWDLNGGNEVAGGDDAGTATDLFNVNAVPLPTFPELGPVRQKLPLGVAMHYVDFAAQPGNGGTPGSRMSLRVYRPAGEHPPRSVPCVLVAPAGTNLLIGSAMDADDYHAETLPYAEAGMVTIFYGLDGECDMETATNNDLAAAYNQFKPAPALAW
ncbi:MAG: hypothetical protein R3B90_17165 [Planctomycetaceae bacterium]